MMHTNEIRLVIPGEPKGKARPRVTQHGTYTPKTTRDRESYIRGVWAQAGGAALNYTEQGIEVEIDAYFPVRKSWSKSTRQYLAGKPHTKKPDLDNVTKLVLDALNGGPYPDDGCIAIVRASKWWTDGQPRTEVTIRAMRRAQS